MDRVWRELMEETSVSNAVLNVTERRNLGLKNSNSLLNQIQKGLADYLNKRIFSPVFFLSNDELLEILSKQKDPLKVLPHLKKCFEGFYSLEFSKTLDIISMISKEKGSISIWLSTKKL